MSNGNEQSALMHQDQQSTGGVVMVEDAERFFMRGSYRSALSRSNRLFVQQQKQQQPPPPPPDVPEGLSNDEYHILLKTPVILFDNPMYVSIRLGMDETSCLRAGAVALQSWHELSKLTTENSSGDGRPHLKPFLNTFTSMGHRHAMSLELFLLWLRFCVLNTNDIDGALGQLGEVLHRVRSMQTIESQADRDACMELVQILFTEWLPSYSSIAGTRDFLRRLRHDDEYTLERHDDVSLRRHDRSHCGSIQKESVQECLCFCNTDDGNWPEWLQGTFQDCRGILQQILGDMYHTTRHCDSGTSNISKQMVGRPRSSDHAAPFSWRDMNSARCTMAQWKETWTALLRWTKRQLILGESSISIKSNKVQVVALVLGLSLYCWRHHRHRMSAAVRRALSVTIAQPLMEILEALGLPRSSSS